MNLNLFILQGAMGGGIVMLYGGIALLIAFSVGYTSMYLSIAKKKYLTGIKENQNRKIIVAYILSFIVGSLTAVLTLALLLGVLIFLWGETPLD